MRQILTAVFLLLFLGAACAAQEWEVGFGGGVAVHKNATVKRGSDTADAGFKTGPVFSAFATQHMYDNLSGEIRYAFGFNDLMLSNGGTETTFSAQTHSVHYGLLFHAGGRDSAVRPYALAGGGMRIFRGTGKETSAAPPLANFAILTKTSEIKGLIVFGGGVKVRAGERVAIRLEVADYLTPVPKDVIAPMTGATLSGWIHSITPMVNISFGF